MTHPSYRRDIDGLRAVAVLSVVGFHAFKAALPGGFIGVDVFFVISGYLICGIILSRVAGNRLDLPAFYARRINRIFPALTLVLACCLVAGSVYMYADEFAELRRHIRAGAFFYANFTLHAEADYWDRASEFKPLLHLWSLAIEEQFYIVFPLLIYVLAKCRVNLTLALVAMIAGSFALNVTRVYSSALDSFYSPHRRFWELLLGGLLAQIEMTGGLSAFFPERFSGWSARSGALVPTVARVSPP